MLHFVTPGPLIIPLQVSSLMPFEGYIRGSMAGTLMQFILNTMFQRWTAVRQMSYEGGFQGRTNKLVDGCYSFWQGGAFPVIHMAMFNEGGRDMNVHL